MRERLEAHDISVVVPQGWDAKIFRHPDGEATLHMGNFVLPRRDGDFGTAATHGMRRGSIFLTLTEYRADYHLQPGVGLFAHRRPSSISLHDFRPNVILQSRPGQRGAQWFFSEAGRAFCLYVVVNAGPRASRLIDDVSHCIQSVRFGRLQ
jgi:hypothetical protein